MLKQRHHQQLVFMFGFALFLTNGNFTILEYIIYQKQLNPGHRKILLFDDF